MVKGMTVTITDAWTRLAADPTVPAPSDADRYIVSPGINGFLTFFVLAIVGWLLFSAMSRSIRKANFHAREREEEMYGQSAGPTRRSIPIDPHLKPRQGPFSETVLGGKEADNSPTTSREGNS